MASYKKNYIYQVIYEILAIVLPLITAPYVTRVLGADNLGVFTYYQSIANVFLRFAILGIVNHGSRSIAKAQNSIRERSSVFWNIYAIQFSASVLVTLIYVIYAVVFVNDNKLIALLMTLQVFSTLFDISWFYMGIEVFKRTVSKNIIVKIASLISLFLLVKSRDDLWIYTIIVLSSLLLGNLSLLIGFKKRCIWIKPTIIEIRRHLKSVLVLFIPSVAVLLYTLMDKIMLGAMIDTKEVGFYEYAAKLVAVPLGFITSFGTVMLPRMSYLSNTEGTVDTRKKLTQKSLCFMVFLSVAFAFGLSSISETLIPFYYGEEFLACITLLVLLSIKLPFMAWANTTRSQILIPNNRDKEYLISLFVGAGVNLALNYWLIMKYKAVGAAIATIIAEITVCLVQSFYCRKNIDIMKTLLKVTPFIIIGILMYCCVRGVAIVVHANDVIRLIIEIAVGGFVYISLSLLYISKVIKKQSIKGAITSMFSLVKEKPT